MLPLTHKTLKCINYNAFTYPQDLKILKDGPISFVSCHQLQVAKETGVFILYIHCIYNLDRPVGT